MGLYRVLGEVTLGPWGCGRSERTCSFKFLGLGGHVVPDGGGGVLGIKSEQEMIYGVKGQPGLGFCWVSVTYWVWGLFRGLKRACLAPASGIA